MKGTNPPTASPKAERDAFARAHADERRQVKRVDQAEWARIENAAKAGWDAALQSSLVRGMAEALEDAIKRLCPASDEHGGADCFARKQAEVLAAFRKETNG